MDLNNRNFRPTQQANNNNSEPASAPQASSQPVNPKKPGKLNRFKRGGALNITYVFLLFSVTIVLVGLLLTLVFFKNASQEEKFVDTSKYQSVFLGNGQVYFGHINELDEGYLSLSDIFYLRVNQQVQPDQQPSQNDVALVKLGCELHGPQDNMVIYKDQITFWENLKDDGQVVKAVNEYKKANPNGQNCEQQAENQTPSNPNEGATDTSPADNPDSGAANDTPNPGDGDDAPNNDTPPVTQPGRQTTPDTP